MFMVKIVPEIKEFSNKMFLTFCLKYLKENYKVLEIGPGDGLFARLLLKKIPLNLEFVDIEDKRKFCKNMPMQIRDISWQNLHKDTASIDVIIASQVIEHLENMSNFFREVHRVLKKDGVLLLKFPNYSNLFQKTIFFIRGTPLRLKGEIDNKGHVNFIPYKYLLNFLKNLFVPIEIRGDIFVDPFLTVFLQKVWKRKLYLTASRLENLTFSWNVMLCLKKKDESFISSGKK
jgi:SAM-dependent methyltransferase